MSSLEDKNIFEGLLNGNAPSDVFNKILLNNPEIDKYDLANLFLEKFCLLDSNVLPIIWHWKSIKSSRGVSDNQFNESILSLMREVGYQI